MFGLLIRNLVRDLLRQPLRTILTLSGVVWGTFSVILLLTFGDSVSKAQMKEFHGMGEGIIIIFPSRTTLPWHGLTKNRPVRITTATVEDIPTKVPGVELVSPEYIGRKMIGYGRKQFNNTVRGVNPQFELMRNTIAEKGRFIDPEDMTARKRVCMLGDTLAEDLFGTEDPVSRTVMVDNVPFLIVGVMRKKNQNSNYNGQQDQRCLFMPWTTYESLYGAKYVSNIVLKPADLDRSKEVMDAVRKHLAEVQGFDPADPDALGVWDTMDFQRQIKTFLLAFTVFLGIIGSFTLLVGGVGVASIMRVVVDERTREIGVKLAVGARRRTILMQFFGESIMIMILGGLIGFGLSAAAVQATHAMPKSGFLDFIGTPVLNPVVILATVLILIVIGVISGLIPARAAASTDPIEALRK